MEVKNEQPVNRHSTDNLPIIKFHVVKREKTQTKAVKDTKAKCLIQSTTKDPRIQLAKTNTEYILEVLVISHPNFCIKYGKLLKDQCEFSG